MTAATHSEFSIKSNFCLKDIPTSPGLCFDEEKVHNSSIQERSSPLGAKMGRGSPVCQQIREKIIEMFKNNVPQRKIGRDLDISPSTVHNIIKRFKESGGISVRKGQGRKPKLNNRDLRSLRRHCIKNRHSSISDITTWA